MASVAAFALAVPLSTAVGLPQRAGQHHSHTALSTCDGDEAGEGHGGPTGRGAGLRPQQFMSILKPATQESRGAGAFGGCGGSKDDRFPEF